MPSRSSQKPNLNLPELPELPETPEIWRTAIRVSDVGGRDKARYGYQFRSPEDQLIQGRHFAERHGGIHDDTASLQGADLNVSGFSKKYTERPGLMRHLEDAKAGKFQHLVFAYTDRSSRGVADGILLYEAFRDAGVTVHYVDNPGTPETDESFEGRRDFNLIVSAEVSRRARRRTLNIIAQRTKEGKPHGDFPAWIQRDQQTDTYVIDEKIAPAFRRMVELRLESKGAFTIAKTLNEEGLRSERDKEWTPATIIRYLSDQYVHLMLGVATITPGGRANDKKGEKIVRLLGAFPALINEETGQRLKQIGADLRESNASVYRKPGQRGRAAETSWWLSGKAYCAICGYSLVASTTRGVRCYRCETGMASVSHADGGTVTDGDSLEDAVARILRLVMERPAALPKKQRAKSPKANKTADMIKELDKRLDRLVQLFSQGLLDVEAYKRNTAPIEKQKKDLLELENTEKQPDQHAAAQSAWNAIGSGEDKSTDVDPFASQRAWRRLLLAAVERIDVLVNLPENAESIVPCGTDALETVMKPLRNSGKPRRFCRVVIKWPVTGWGTVFYAPLYRRTYQQDRLAFIVPPMEIVSM